MDSRKERIIMQVSAIIEPGTTTWYFSYSSTEIHLMINNWIEEQSFYAVFKFYHALSLKFSRNERKRLLNARDCLILRFVVLYIWRL